MTRRLFYSALVLMLALAAAGLWWRAEGLRQAPRITLSLLDGNALELASLRGRPVLVNFWATTCLPCRKELPHLKDLYEAFASQGLEIIAIAAPYDPPAQVYEFTQQHAVPWRVALDLEGTASRAFGDVQLIPATFVISPDGRIVYHEVGLFDPDSMRVLIRDLLKDGGKSQ